MTDQASLGHKAIAAKDYQKAIEYLSAALKSGSAPSWYIDRSIAYQRTHQFDLALYDAETALLGARSRGRRELMASAQFRRAVALHGLGRMGDSRVALTWAQKLNDKDRAVGFYQNKVAQDYEALGAENENRKITIEEFPQKLETVNKPTAEVASRPATSSTPAHATLATPAAPPTIPTAANIRQEWIQSASKVTITLYAKNVPKDKAEIEFTAHSLAVEFPTANGSSYNYTLLPLFAEIDPAQSVFNITAYKVEISLHKKIAGIKWTTLEGTEMPKENVAPEESSDMKNAALGEPSQPSSGKAPSYPSSAKNKIDWNAIELEDEDESKDGADAFFNQLYKNADPDTKRAMMKSMQESNGTTLSTDWSDIGSRTVETKPPEGVEEKKWTK